MSGFCAMTPKQVFVREATGLVREASWFDVFMYNEVGMSFAGSMIMTSMFAIIILGGDFFTAWCGYDNFRRFHRSDLLPALCYDAENRC